MKFKYIYLLGIVLLSCNTVDGNKTLSFDEAKAQWEAFGADSYSYILNTYCFCNNTGAEIYVENNKVVAVYKPGTNEKLVDINPNDGLEAEIASRYPTIDELFEEIVEAKERGNSVRAEFDHRVGMPVEIVVNEEQMAWDGGYALFASQLERIK